MNILKNVLNTLKEVNKINVLYNNKYKSIKRDMFIFNNIRNNSINNRYNPSSTRFY